MSLANQDEGMPRRYLLGQMDDEEQAIVEQRLLTDDDFFAELEMCRDELVESYLAHELTAAERESFEQNFLASPEGKRAKGFARALNRYVINQRTASEKPGWAEQLAAFWRSQTVLLRGAAAVAVILIVVGIFWVASWQRPQSIATIELPNTIFTRSGEQPVRRVTLATDVLRVNLKLPMAPAPGTRYRAELRSDKGASQVWEGIVPEGQSVSLDIPAKQLSAGLFSINISAQGTDGSLSRVPGSYQVIIE